MREALWSVEFISTEGIFGAGVAIFESGRVFGGDSQYYYLGSYSVVDGSLTGDLEVVHFSGPPSSAFGPAERFNLRITGPVEEPIMEFHGNIVENPTKQIRIRLTKRADLP